MKLLLHKKLSPEAATGGAEEGLEIVSLTMEGDDEDQRVDDQLNEVGHLYKCKQNPESL